MSIPVCRPRDPTSLGQQVLGFSSVPSICLHPEVPSALDSCTGLIEYLTMIVFNCSAQHATTNSGQMRVCQTRWG